MEQLQIAPALLNELFGGLVATVALAVGLSFGLGGQETARKWLTRGESKASEAASQISAQQQTQPIVDNSQVQPAQMRSPQPR